MKKYLMIGAATLVLGGTFVGCTKEKDLYDPQKNAYEFLQNYRDAFIKAFGEVYNDQTWGFSDGAASRATRSAEAPSVAGIEQPWSEEDVTAYLATAKEPNSENVADNYDNGYYQGASGSITVDPTLPDFSNGTISNNIMYSGGTLASVDDKAFYENTWLPLLNEYNSLPIEWNGEAKVNTFNAKVDKFMELYNAVVAYAGEDGISNWLDITSMGSKGVYTVTEGTWVADETFVTNFKITGTYTGTIGVAASEGYTISYGSNGEAIYGERQDPFLARTVVVTGTWNINDNQRMGSGSTIVIANGGKVDIASGKQLETVNHARIVVLPGGELTGAGSVLVSNGNGTGEENYNGGTVSVAKFNNNFGKFFNYGDFLVEEYIGGAKESNFYNHSLVHIKYTGLNNETPNARIFNACQWYCENNMRCRNYEGVQGSAFIVGGQLMMSSSEDGTGDPTYVGLEAGALVQAGSLFNNGTSWTGPTENGYAVLSIGQFDHMNWEQDHPEQGGYFANNIYLQADDLTNVPTGNGYQQKDPTDAYNHSLSIAEYKFENIVANAVGNGNVTVVDKGDEEVIPADNDFELGVKGCTPGFKITPPGDKPTVKKIRVMAEDVSAQEKGDFDFNDVVFDVEATFPVGVTEVNEVTVTVYAAGGTLPLKIGSTKGEGGFEVHGAMGETTNTMINTAAEPYADGVHWFAKDGVPAYTTTLTLNDAISVESFNSDVNNYVRVEVEKTEGSWLLLTAQRGQPCCKIGVPVTTPWAMEKTHMNTAFPGFTDWVNNGTEGWQTRGVSGKVLYNE